MPHADGKVAGLSGVVTGGARGLGRAMTEALVAEGASVLVADTVPDPEIADDTQLVTITADISTPDGAEQAVQTCVNRFGGIDFVINNAGVLMRTARKRSGVTGYLNFWDVDADTVRLFLDVHVIGSFLVSKAAVPHLRAKGRGRIITISTSFATMLEGSRTPYGPAKAGMEAFASIMAADLADSGVTVNVLIPGHAKTPDGVREDPLAAERGPDGRRLHPRIPAAIMGPPAVWLVSDASAGFSGMRINAVDWDPDIPVADAVAASSDPIAWAALDR